MHFDGAAMIALPSALIAGLVVFAMTRDAKYSMAWLLVVFAILFPWVPHG